MDNYDECHSENIKQCITDDSRLIELGAVVDKIRTHNFYASAASLCMFVPQSAVQNKSFDGFLFWPNS